MFKMQCKLCNICKVSIVKHHLHANKSYKHFPITISADFTLPTGCIFRYCPVYIILSFWKLCHESGIILLAGYIHVAALTYGPRQANLVLIAYASSEGSGKPAHPRSLARTFAARSYKQWVKRNLQTESQISGPSEWLGMRSWNLSWRNARRHKFAWRGPYYVCCKSISLLELCWHLNYQTLRIWCYNYIIVMFPVLIFFLFNWKRIKLFVYICVLRKVGIGIILELACAKWEFSLCCAILEW